jgi:hypothetical protein
MDNILIELGSVIEELRVKQSNSGCQQEEENYERLITVLNKVYDELVYTRSL